MKALNGEFLVSDQGPSSIDSSASPPVHGQHAGELQSLVPKSSLTAFVEESRAPLAELPSPVSTSLLPASLEESSLTAFVEASRAPFAELPSPVSTSLLPALLEKSVDPVAELRLPSPVSTASLGALLEASRGLPTELPLPASTSSTASSLSGPSTPP
eukprot:CAMPEP_0180713430 /NCGR_PEP_ID=MMETSP1038_2-20121128/11890_1 /TAXON_ID=632150 /ORGANISM="Azadinium spinosum, Strain 3D9" /LENGTH=157 /DNA_ID=CAMNT_0022745739 /DNA_START=64 /DNA_END=534 /DNA_ORIENTATION=-